MRQARSTEGRGSAGADSGRPRVGPVGHVGIVRRQRAEVTEGVRLRHVRVRLDDGHEVGVSIGGAGVPLVFLHGIALNRHAYRELLSRLAAMGFLVVAPDAPGHGDTAGFGARPDTFPARVAMTRRLLDTLGVREAVLVGHSMGGRTAAELAALDPERAVAAVLVSAALGDPFDRLWESGLSPRSLAAGLASATADTVVEQLALRRPGARWSLELAGRVTRSTVTDPLWFLRALRAVVATSHDVPPLAALRRAGVPVVVVHGRRDLVVPFASARDVCAQVDGTLVSLPTGYHSWLVRCPGTFVDLIEDLLEAELGTAVQRARQRAGLGRRAGPEAVSRAFCAPGALLLELVPPLAPVRVRLPGLPAGRRVFVREVVSGARRGEGTALSRRQPA